MSDERNADSVLFKLDNLKDIQRAEQQQKQPGSAPQSRLAAPAPASGGSGLIDIRSLAGADAEAAEAASAAPPVVASDGSGLIDVAKLADADADADARSATTTNPNAALISSGTLGVMPAPQPSSAPTQAPSRTPMIVLSVLALLALAAAVAAILTRGL